MRRWFAVGLLVFGTLTAGCGSAEDGTAQVSVSRDGSSVVLTSSAPGRSDVNTQCITKGTPAVCASSFTWPAKGVADLYLYGLAPAGATDFQTSPSGTAKIQADGTFLAVFPGLANSPIQSIHWSFLASDGTILAQGDGSNV